MRHRVKKTKFGKGIDANQMLMKKLVYNFFMRGTLVTTESRVKALQSLIDILVHKMKDESSADRAFILRYVPNNVLVDKFQTAIRPSIGDRVSGFTRRVRLEQRENDGSMMARLEWINPVILEKPVVKKKTTPKTETK